MRASRVAFAAWLAVLVSVAAIFAGPGFAQTGPRVIDTDRLDRQMGVPIAHPGVASAPPSKPSVPAGAAGVRFVLRRVDVQGARSVPPAVLEAAWSSLIGHPVDGPAVYRIADSIGAAYKNAGLPLYQVTVPRQNFAGGVVVIHVVEGHVGDVVIQGAAKGSDLSLLKAHAAHIVADRPLRQATLEREILLMNVIPGLQVGSKFEPLPGEPGAVRLVLTVKQKRFEILAGINNQGVNVLGRVELYGGAAVNSVLQEGDRTEFLFGAPVTFSRYQYYGVTHIMPLGQDGTTLTINLGDLVTHAVDGSLSGNATVAGLTLSHPLILRLHEALVATGEFDFIDSNDALLGTELSDERTRALRAGLNYTRLDQWQGIDGAGVTVSEGLNVLGARRGGVVYGGPDFTKFNLRLQRDQPLPWDLVVRVRGTAQYGVSRLPASEAFIFGSPGYGQAFAANPLYGDQGFAVYGELARKIAWSKLPVWATGTEVFGFTDRGEIWNRPGFGQVATDIAASAGVGVRVKLLDKLTLQVAAANAIVEPTSVPAAARWSAMFTVAGSF